ncbi:MAG: serine hydrolase [Chitinophagaceae bacterium]|nr:MAG: serine hydrolase [Chitinophagaceae bacterium]
MKFNSKHFFLPRSTKNGLRSLSLVLLFALWLPFYASAQHKPDLKALEQYIENARQEWEIPGMAVAIVKNDTVIFAKGFGVTDILKKNPVNENTLFAIASNSKAFTSASLAILVDEKKITWDDKVTKHLPYFKLQDECATKEMTIRDLLSHKSGLKTFSGDLLWFGSNISREEIVKRARFIKPSYGFRTKYGYQNIMFIAAGEVIPAVSGKTWDEFVKERFLQPLGMNRTNTSILAQATDKNVAQPHVRWNGKMQPVPYLNYDNSGSAAAINSSVNDMTRWIRLHLNKGTLEGKKYFGEDVHRDMWTPQTLNPMSKGAEKLWPSKHFQAYGLGWDLFDYHGRKVVNHSGGLEGMISQVVMVPEEKLGFVVLTNTDNSLPYALMYEITDRFLGEDGRDWSKVLLEFKKAGQKRDAEAKEKLEKERPKNAKPAHKLKEYAGTYRSELYGDVVVKAEGKKLTFQMVPSPLYKGELNIWEKDEFVLSWSHPTFLPGGRVTFVADDKGNIVEMKMDVPNPDFDFTELELKKVN